MTIAVALALASALAVPHRLRLDGADASVAAVIWGAALALRALVAVGLATLFVLWLPGTGLFQLVTHWCWHRVLPFVAVHLGLSGHRVGDVAVILPATLLTASIVWVSFGLWRGARAVRLLLHRGTIGPGPGHSVVIPDGQVVVAAAGLRRPRVLVSAGALVAFDEDELDVSLAHERGHIERRHRFILVAAELARGAARFLPGTRRAAEELRFHLERDADAFALRRRPDPAALASAICKAAAPGVFGIAPSTALPGAGHTTRRVQGLLEGGPLAAPPAPLRLRMLAAVLVFAVVATAGALPFAAHAGAVTKAPVIEHCRT